MKRLVCEMCGSTDLMKTEGVFVCQSCGTMYSVEEAKKMMVEGTIDVSGSVVKVDSSDRLSNLLLLANRAREDINVHKLTEPKILSSSGNSASARYPAMVSLPPQTLSCG